MTEIKVWNNDFCKDDIEKLKIGDKICFKRDKTDDDYDVFEDTQTDYIDDKTVFGGIIYGDNYEKCDEDDCDWGCFLDECECGFDREDYYDKYGRDIFCVSDNGLLKFHLVEVEGGGDAFYCDVKRDVLITKLDNFKYEIWYHNISRDKTGSERFIRPRNLKFYCHQEVPRNQVKMGYKIVVDEKTLRDFIDDEGYIFLSPVACLR